MADTVEQVESTETIKQEETRTFTQAEVDAIVHKRLKDYDNLKAKAQRLDELEEASKTELQKATERADALQAQLDTIKQEKELSDMRNKISAETGVPAHLLSGSTEEECATQAKAILDFAKPNPYPTVKDSGENNKPRSKTDAELFGEWFDTALPK